MKTGLLLVMTTKKPKHFVLLNKLKKLEHTPTHSYNHVTQLHRPCISDITNTYTSTKTGDPQANTHIYKTRKPRRVHTQIPYTLTYKPTPFSKQGGQCILEKGFVHLTFVPRPDSQTHLIPLLQTSRDSNCVTTVLTHLPPSS